MEERRGDYPTILETLARLDERTQGMESTIMRTHTILTTLNGRIRRLEQWRAILIGGMTVIVFLLSLIVPHALAMWWKGGAG